MLPSRFWYEMPTTHFAGDTSEWIAILPIAAVEQHGPHLPVGVDAIIAEEMVARCAKALPESSPAVFLPVQAIGKSNEHVNFPGTLTIGWQNAIESWIEIGQSICRAGVRKFVIVNSHGGNSALMAVVARELREKHHMLAITTSWSSVGDWQTLYDYDPPITDIHGGLSETSVMLALRPDLVDMTKAADFPSRQADFKAINKHLGLHSSNANVAWLSEDLNTEGVVGDASAASAELGARDVESMLQGFCALMEEIQNTDPPAQPS